MQSTLRMGRLGPLNISFSYTWILASILGLWWLALLRLPDNFPDKSSIFYWAAAVIVFLLYIASVIAHELVHSFVAGTGSRNVDLYPFGAAMPFGTRRIEPTKTLLSALLAPIFNIVLGLVLLWLGSALAGDGPQEFVRAVATPLGLLNMALGLVNFIPGTPFDAGWALRSFIILFSDDYESGISLSGIVGTLASFALILVGAWIGLTSDSWLLALAFVLVGWSAREASAAGQRRRMIGYVYGQLQASSFMEPSSPADTVPAESSVADMALSRRGSHPHTPLAVVDQDGKLMGIVTLSQVNKLLQGAWPTTPVTALMTRLPEAHALPPNASLTSLLNAARSLPDTADEESYIPIVENNRLVGSVNPGRLQAYEEVEQAFGIGDTTADPPIRSTRFRKIAAVIPALIVVAFAVILGNLALRTNPTEPVTIAPGSSHIVFANYAPADGSIVNSGASMLSVQAVAVSPITTVTMTLDGQPLPAELGGTSPLTRTITANLPAISQGVHDVSVTAGTESGKSKTAHWQFRVSLRGEGDSGTGTGQADPGTNGVQIVDFKPAVGGRVLASEESLPLTVVITGPEQPASAQVYIDGQAIDSKLLQVGGTTNRYTVSAEAPSVGAGAHQVRVELEQPTGDLYTFQWFFSALNPDADNVYYKETGYFIAQPFLDYWKAHGGLEIFGYPISYRVQETDKANGEVYTAQYFQRARFELHPSTGSQVILGRLGAIVHPPEAATQPKEGAQFFSETGHNLSGPFLDYWKAHGGLAVFGYPISEERTEQNPVDGKEYKVQYFERNRFELHPDKAGTPYEVQLGLLGTQIYQARGR